MMLTFLFNAVALYLYISATSERDAEVVIGGTVARFGRVCTLERTECLVMAENAVVGVSLTVSG